MAKDTSFHDYILYDILGESDLQFSSKSMFGGWCIYINKKPCGAIIENTLYVKAKDDFVKELQNQGSVQFTYTKKGKEQSIAWWSIDENHFNQNSLEEFFTRGLGQFSK